MKRLPTIAVALFAVTAAPAAIAQTQSANSNTTFSSHGNPQPAQNSASSSKKAMASHHRRMPKTTSNKAMSAQPNLRPDLNNMTATEH